MNTIIKAILRFFKYSKLSFVGLFLLILFSSTVFTTLNNTTINLNSSYSKISNDGNLHDFVINENYRYGNGNYVLDTKPSDATDKGNLEITAISSTSSTLAASKEYNVTFKLNTTIALDQSNPSLYWSYAYNQILQKYVDNTLDNKEKFEPFVNFTKTITLSEAQEITLENWAKDTVFVSAVNDYLSSKQTDLNIFVTSAYKQFYLNNLQQEFNVSVRSFNSINITNTKQGIFYKAIESSPENEIDKLVIYGGNNLSKKWDVDFSEYKNYTKNDYKTNPELSRAIVPYLAKAKWSDSSIKFDDLQTFVENNLNFNPYDYTSFPTTPSEVKTQASNLVSILDASGVVDKGYGITFSYKKLGLIPITGTIMDLSGYGIVMSPEYVQRNNKKIINYDEWTNHQKDKQEEFDNWMRSLPDENKVSIDNNDFVLLGAGVSPDFMYPILSFQNVVPNPLTEQAVYVNESGYAKIVDGFRGNEQENFLVGKFPSNVNEKDLLAKINVFNQNYMAWPSNINSSFMFDDIANTFSPTPLRMQFIPKVVLTMTTISAFLTTFIVLLSVFISIVIIQRFVQMNRNSLGIMQANGYKKWQIIIGVCSLIIIPVIASTIIGYIIGFAVQPNILKLLGNFWTIPTAVAPFSFAVMSTLLVIAIVIFMLVTAFFTWWNLRGETAEFMKDEAKYKMSKIAQIMKKPFTKFNIITRFRAAVAFTSIWRIILLSVMTSGLMMSLTFSLNILGTFQHASDKTFFEPRNYSYSINLITPTLQAGQYYAVPYQTQGTTYDKEKYFASTLDLSGVSKENQITQNYETAGAYKNYLTPGNKDYNAVLAENVAKFGNIQLVSQQDSTDQNEQAFYLKNKSTIKSFVDMSLGLGSLSSNPWNLAAQMMPPNNAAYANNAFKNLFESAVKNNDPEHQINIGKKLTSTTPLSQTKVVDGTQFETNTYYNYIKEFVKAYAIPKQTTILETGNTTTQNPSIDGITSITQTTQEAINNNDSVFYSAIDSEKDQYWNYYFEFDDSKIAGNNSFIKTEVNINFLNLLYAIYSDPLFSDYTYSINYGKVVVNNDKDNNNNPIDSPYTYLDFNINEVNNKAYSVPDNFVATGLLENDTRISLSNQSNKKINELVWNTPIGSYKEHDVYPIIINAYAAKVYDLAKGDLLKTTITNSADRYSRQHFGVENPTTYFKVVDITTTYQGAEFYVSQYDANKILGLTINNLKPKVPTTKDEIKDYVDWTNLEFDYANSYQQSTSTNDGLTLTIPSKDNFIQENSGFNGIFSSSNGDVKEVTAGISLYAVSGVYPGTDKFSISDQVIKSVFGTGKTAKTNLQKLIEITGFSDLSTSDWTTVVNEVNRIFGDSASFSIISGADSINSKYEIIKTMSETSRNIQNIVLGIISIITIIIVVVISSIIINDSIKLAAILKCLGLADGNNALSFLSVYFPVFIFGLIISVPLTMLLSYIYIQVILGFAGILLVVTPVWWHFVVAALGVIIIFALSYWTAWKRIAEMDLTNIIK